MKAEPNCAVKKMNAAEMEELLEMFDPLREPQKQEASPTDCKLEEAMGMSSLAPVQSTTNLVDEGILISFDDDVEPPVKDAPGLKKEETSAIDCDPAEMVGKSGVTPINLAEEANLISFDDNVDPPKKDEPELKQEVASPTGCKLKALLGTSNLALEQSTKNLADEANLISFDDNVDPPKKDEPELKQEVASPTGCKLEVVLGTSNLAPAQSTTNLADEANLISFDDDVKPVSGLLSTAVVADIPEESTAFEDGLAYAVKLFVDAFPNGCSVEQFCDFETLATRNKARDHPAFRFPSSCHSFIDLIVKGRLTLNVVANKVELAKERRTGDADGGSPPTTYSLGLGDG